MDDCVQWNHVTIEKIHASSESGTLDQHSALNQLSYRGSSLSLSLSRRRLDIDFNTV